MCCIETGTNAIKALTDQLINNRYGCSHNCREKEQTGKSSVSSTNHAAGGKGNWLALSNALQRNLKILTNL